MGTSEKKTYISGISNSVTNLSSYTNTAMADIARSSAPSTNITAPSVKLSISPYRAPASPHRVASNGECFGVSQYFISVSWCFTSVLRCFTSVSRYFIMYSELHNDRHRRLCDHESPQGSAIMSQRLAIMPQGSLIAQKMWSHAELSPEWRLE